MNNESFEINKISKVFDNVFLSGIYPLQSQSQLIKNLKIKYILSCVKRDGIEKIHDKILLENPDVVIFYIPYHDDTNQNLWMLNHNYIDIHRYYTKPSEFDETKQMMNRYYNKTMIEIAYNIINNAVENNENILVHCMAGISRSVSMIIYYLMKKYNLSYDNSYYIIKHTRPIVNPNESFKTQLKAYQTKKQYFTHSDANNVIQFLKMNR